MLDFILKIELFISLKYNIFIVGNICNIGVVIYDCTIFYLLGRLECVKWFMQPLIKLNSKVTFSLTIKIIPLLAFDSIRYLNCWY